MTKYTAIIGAIAATIVVVLWIVSARVVQAPGPLAPGSSACTQEAKLCPDGGSVGRTGPNCEFAECPSDKPVSLEVRIGEEVSGLGVNIAPLKVLQDSRCPVDVVCIQAGTVTVRARLVSDLGTSTPEFTIDKPITTEAETVTLVEVTPQPKAGIKIKESAYVFRFEVIER
jgi:hypothetical protein